MDQQGEHFGAQPAAERALAAACKLSSTPTLNECYHLLVKLHGVRFAMDAYKETPQASTLVKLARELFKVGEIVEAKKKNTSVEDLYVLIELDRTATQFIHWVASV